jgi:putative thioredoxin
MSANVTDVSAAEFDTEVVEASKQVPVVVDFWAPWCGPCRALGPILEKLALEYDGKFKLAKVNSDHNLTLSTEYGVRGIPAVKAFVGGEIVDEFTGALPESSVRRFIERLLPAPSEALRRKADAMRATGNIAGAMASLQEALQADPASDAVRLDLAELLLEQGDVATARPLIDTLTVSIPLDPQLKRLRSRMALLEGLLTSAEELELKRKIAEAPDDLRARLALAQSYAARNEYPLALSELLEIVRRDRNFEQGMAKRLMVEIFDLAQGQHDLVGHYRRELSSVLY